MTLGKREQPQVFCSRFKSYIYDCGLQLFFPILLIISVDCFNAHKYCVAVHYKDQDVKYTERLKGFLRNGKERNHVNV